VYAFYEIISRTSKGDIIIYNETLFVIWKTLLLFIANDVLHDFHKI